MSSKESVTLYLNGNNLTSGSTNNYGYSNSLNTNLRFDNINMKLLLGSLVEKYTRFNISLKTVSCQLGINGPPAMVNIKISGLNFISSYDIIGKNNGLVSAGIINTAATNVPSVMVVYDIYNTFIYSDEIISLTIKMNTLSTNDLSASQYGVFTFLFVITPVE